MARTRKTKTKILMTGLNFPTTEFYANKKTIDGLHPYSKQADNFRRRLSGTNVGTNELREMFTNLITKTA